MGGSAVAIVIAFLSRCEKKWNVKGRLKRLSGVRRRSNKHQMKNRGEEDNLSNRRKKYKLKYRGEENDPSKNNNSFSSSSTVEKRLDKLQDDLADLKTSQEDLAGQMKASQEDLAE